MASMKQFIYTPTCRKNRRIYQSYVGNSKSISTNTSVYFHYRPTVSQTKTQKVYNTYER